MIGLYIRSCVAYKHYQVKAGDVIEWNYTCDLGLDLDGGWWDGAQDWKDTHE